MAEIVDIDGTILRSGVFPMPNAIAAVNRLKDVYLITGRPESDRAKTVATLKKLGVNYSVLLMNNIGTDEASQLQSKVKNAHALIAHKQVSVAIDDNPKAQAAYKSLGIREVLGGLADG